MENVNKRVATGGSIAQWLTYLLRNPASLGSIPSILNKIQWEKYLLLKLINGSDKRIVDSGLKMSIELI